MNQKYIITIDLGGTDMENGKQGLVSSIAESVKSIIAENEISQKEVKAVCLGVPGTVNPYTGLIGSAPNLGIKNYNIKEAMLDHITIPVLIENDVNLAGLGIKKIELKDKINNLMERFIEVQLSLQVKLVICW